MRQSTENHAAVGSDSGIAMVPRMTTQVFPDLRKFLDQLSGDGDLRVIEAPVDPNLEIAEIHRRVIAAGGPFGRRDRRSPLSPTSSERRVAPNLPSVFVRRNSCGPWSS